MRLSFNHVGRKTHWVDTPRASQHTPRASQHTPRASQLTEPGGAEKVLQSLMRLSSAPLRHQCA